MFELTVFESAFDIKTHRKVRLDSWDDFTNMLRSLSEKPGYKPKKGDWTPGSSLISPAVYNEGATRNNKGVLKWGCWAALDVDDYEGTFEDALARYSDYQYICYSTASSTKEHPKFRVVFQLKRDVKSDKIKHFWFAINTQFNEMGDAQTKDLSRMYYVPAVYPGAYNFFITYEGEIIDPDTLMMKYPWSDNTKLSFYDRLPDAVKDELLNRRKDQMTNNNIRWTDYKDCPFVSKKMVIQYALLTNGWYHMMYRIMVSIAMSAINKKYPISSKEISTLCKGIDMDNGHWYKDRPIEIEADRAIEYAYKNADII